MSGGAMKLVDLVSAVFADMSAKVVRFEAEIITFIISF